MKKSGVEAYNLGTGNGYSVLNMVKAFENAGRKKVPYKIVERRPGDGNQIIQMDMIKTC